MDVAERFVARSRHYLVYEYPTKIKRCLIDAVYHVVEHFSTHTGQIILLTKSLTEGRIQFYEDANGLAVPVWGHE